MDPASFEIVFLKLSEVASTVHRSEASPAEAEEISSDLVEIAKLKKLFLEITDPEPKSYTVT